MTIEILAFQRAARYSFDINLIRWHAGDNRNEILGRIRFHISSFLFHNIGFIHGNLFLLSPASVWQQFSVLYLYIFFHLLPRTFGYFSEIPNKQFTALASTLLRLIQIILQIFQSFQVERDFYVTAGVVYCHRYTRSNKNANYQVAMPSYTERQTHAKYFHLHYDFTPFRGKDVIIATFQFYYRSNIRIPYSKSGIIPGSSIYNLAFRKHLNQLRVLFFQSSIIITLRYETDNHPTLGLGTYCINKNANILNQTTSHHTELPILQRLYTLKYCTQNI